MTAAIEDHEPEEEHIGHYSRITGEWFCDTCESHYCQLA